MPDTAAQFKKGDKVLRSRGESYKPTAHTIVSGPHKAGNYPECYVISGEPAMVPVSVLTADTPASSAAPADGTPATPEILGTINAPAPEPAT
jgi:hypothetical protein